MCKHSLSKEDTIYIKKVIICTFSIVLLGFGVALNTRAMLGNDPITVFYEGFGLKTGVNMGLAANIVSAILVVAVFLLDRHYINVGTLIYAAVLGLSITYSLSLYDSLNIPYTLMNRVITVLIGYTISTTAVGAFVAIDIGIDPWMASAIIIGKKLDKPFGLVKACIDVSMLIIGYFMGGTVGVMTFVSAILGGPAVQKISEFLDKVFAKMVE